MCVCVCVLFKGNKSGFETRSLFSSLAILISKSFFFYVLLFCVFNTKRERICVNTIKERSFFFLRDDDGARVRLK